MKYLRYGSYVLGLLTLVVAYTLFNTTTGLRLLISFIDDLTPVTISARVTAGSLNGGAEIRDLRVEDAGYRVSIARLALQWQVYALVSGRFNIPYIEVENIDVFTGGDTAPKREGKLNLWMPPLNIDSLTVDDVEVTGPEQKQLLQLDAVRLALTSTQDKYVIQNASSGNRWFTLDVNGTLERSTPYDMRMYSQLVITRGSRPGLTADVHLDGNLDELLVNVGMHEAIEGDATISIRKLVQEPEWNAVVSLVNIDTRKFDDSLPGISGDANLQLDGNTWRAGGRGRAHLVYLDDTPGRRELDTEFELTVDRSDDDLRINLETMKMSVQNGEIILSGNYRHKTGQLEINTAWEGLIWPAAPPEHVLASSGNLSASGRLDDYIITTTVNLDAGPEIPALRLLADGRGNTDELTIDNAVISTALGAITANVRASLGVSPAVRVTWHGEGLDPGKHWPRWQGKLTTDGDIQVTAREQNWVWVVPGASVAGTLRNSPLSLKVVANSSAGGTAQVNARLDYARALAEVSGAFGDTLDLTWQLGSTDLSRVHPELQGEIDSSGTLTGTLDKPAVNATLNGNRIRSPWASAETVNADLLFDLATDGPIRADINLRDIKSGGLDLVQLDLEISGQNSRHRFEINTALEGTELGLSGLGGLQNQRWSGRVDSMFAENETYKRWETSEVFNVNVGRDELRIEKFCLDQADSSLCAGGSYRAGDATWQIETNASQVPFAMFQDKLPDTMLLDGLASFVMELKGRAQKPVAGKARLDISTGTITLAVTDGVDNQLTLDQAYLDFQLDENKMTIIGQVPSPGVGFKVFDTRLEVSGLAEPSYSLEKMPVNGELKWGIGDLSIISAVWPQLVEVRGLLDLDIQVSGSASEPVYDGSMKLDAGGFRSSDLGIEVRDINFEGTRSAENRYEIAGELQSGEGYLVTTAVAGQLDQRGPEFRVDLEGEDFELVNLPELWARVNPAITGVLSLRKQVFEGTIVIPAARINLDEVVLPPSVSADEIIDNDEAKNGSRRVNSQVNVRLVLGENVEITGKGITGRLVGNLDLVTNQQGQLIGNGEIAISDGQFAAYGQKLVIEQGRLVYNNSLLDNPVLDVIASRTVDNIKVGLRITGYTTDPQISLYSSLSMPQEEILSYIVFGRSLSSLSSGEGTDLLGAATAMGLENSGFVTSKVAAAFGLDQFSVSGSTAQSASLVIGKYINPKLYLSYGLGIFDKISTARLKYDLSSRFSLEAERGAETGVDVFYEIDR